MRTKTGLPSITIESNSLLTNSSHIAINNHQWQGSYREDSPAVLLPIEAWCLSHLDIWYAKSQMTKCPFLRRRAGDFLDVVEAATKHTLIRRQCWPLMGMPQGCRPAGYNKKLRQINFRGLSLGQMKKHISKDWKMDSGKGYYITGKLTTAIYRDDCVFDGDDPDLPIRGVRKYAGVAANLFDYEKSCCTLKSLDIVDDMMIAHWKLQATLRLPWKPQIPLTHGTTRYFFDEDGLIERHEESWDISTVEAFGRTFFPDFWNQHHGRVDSETIGSSD
jgi:hypothetical protein